MKKQFLFLLFLIPLLIYGQCDEKRLCLQNSYKAYIGVREETGHNDGSLIELFIENAGFARNSQIPWCAAMVNTVLLNCDINLNLKAPAYVPSYFTEKTLIYERGKINKRPPLPGDVIGIWFESKQRLAHIGFWDSQDGDMVITVEGNTNEAGSREGDGVYRKRRIERQIHSIATVL